MRKIWGVAGLAAIALTVSACGSSGSSSSGTAANTPAAGGNSSSAPAAASGSTVTEKTIGSQQVLVDSNGMTLYWFVPDTSTKSNCSGQCATYWPPVKGPLTARSGLTGTLGTIPRAPAPPPATSYGHPP